MGTWGDGIYDNDSALDFLGDLVRVTGEERDAAELVARIGLLAWLNPSSAVYRADQLRGFVAARGADIDNLPAETAAALRALLEDPEAATQPRSREPGSAGAIGGHSDGPRIDALLRFPGAEPAIRALEERAAKRLDSALAADVELYEIAGDLAALGVLIELAAAGLWTPPPPQVTRWRAGFAAIDKRTRDERKFWWRYVRRVRAGFDLLAPEPPAPPPAPPVVRRATTIELPAPGCRYLHPKLGPATLVARFGAGASETLELRFDDGEVRKVLARFVELLPR